MIDQQRRPNASHHTMKKLDDIIGERIPDGWRWCLYSAYDGFEPRAVVTSPDHRVHIGRTGKTIDEALRCAVRDAKAGCRE